MECQVQRPLWGQVQVSPASVVAELNAVVGAAFEAADDDDASSLAVLGDAGLSARCQAACSPLPHAVPLRGFAFGRKVIPPDARRSDQVLSVTSFRL
jgi:hypothetical protein